MSRLVRALDGIEKFSAFMKALEAVGANLSNSIEARLYEGVEDSASTALEMRVGFRRWEALVVGADRSGLGALKRYIVNLPLCRTWRFRVVDRVARIEPGVFTLVERHCIKEGQPEEVAAIIRRFGGDDEDERYFLGVEEKQLGFIPWKDERSARAVANLIDAGAMSPADPAEAAAMREHLIRIARTRQLR